MLTAVRADGNPKTNPSHPVLTPLRSHNPQPKTPVSKVRANEFDKTNSTKAEPCQPFPANHQPKRGA